jgi:hypothetical protein
LHFLFVFVHRKNFCLTFRLFVCLQWETNCSTLTLQKFLNALADGRLGRLVRKHKGNEMPKRVKCADKKMQSMAGMRRVYLHGCVGECKKKVWVPEDTENLCEHCGENRFDSTGKPQEFIVHFPLMDQLKSLLRCRPFQTALLWEGQRENMQTNPDYMSGITRKDSLIRGPN